MSEVICKRLRELSTAVTKGPKAVRREFDMRVPAEPDRDADLVLVRAAMLFEALEKKVKELERYKTYFEFLEGTAEYYAEDHIEPSPAEFHIRWSWQQHKPNESWFDAFKQDVKRWQQALQNKEQ